MRFHFPAARRAGPTLALALVLSLGVTPARADACHDEIAALFDGGPLDPFALPPHRFTHVVTGQDGSPRYAMTVTFESPVRMMTEMDTGMRSLVIGSESWMAQGKAAGWTKVPNVLPDDMAALHARNRDQMRANLTATECLGLVQVDGQPLTAYRYATQTDPDPAGIYYGATYTTYLDPDSGMKMRQEVDREISHYQPQPGTDHTVQVFTYDDSIAVMPPGE